MTSWVRGAKLDQASFADRFFGRAADDPVVAKLRSAAMGASMAKSHDELRDAASDLASAQQLIGLDRWRGFLADAQQRADDPATVIAVEKSQTPPDAAKDAIRPVYPVEIAIGIAAAALTGGAAAAVRAAGGAVLRQIVPHHRAITNQTIAGRPAKALSDSGRAIDPADAGGELSRAGRALQKHAGRSQSAFAPASGSPARMNLQGQDVLDGILRDPGSTTRSGNRFGGFDVISPDGRGARFDAEGVFRGFLEPSR